MNRRHVLMPMAAAAMATLMAGCAGIRNLSADVASYGEWPAERKPGSYAFDRLPSQQARAEEAEMLENSARAALEKAGFKPVEAGKEPDVLVQVGAHDRRYIVVPWQDPLWYRGGFGYWRYGPYMSPRWGLGMRYDYYPRYDRQVAVLIRDRASGKPLFEARASSDSGTRSDATTLAAMFEAALMDFPRLGVNPRRVVVDLPPG